MIIVIDAYNVLKQCIHDREIAEHERAHFLSELSSYGRKKRHKLIVVFDGGANEWPTKERSDGTCVIYSGYHETADDYIKTYLKKHRMQDILLVSSDRELNRVADNLDIPSLDAADFYRIIKDEVEKSSSDCFDMSGLIIKTSDQERPELDRIMQECSKYVEYKLEDVVGGYIEKDNKKLTKKERKLIKKLKKL